MLPIEEFEFKTANLGFKSRTMYTECFKYGSDIFFSVNSLLNFETLSFNN